MRKVFELSKPSQTGVRDVLRLCPCPGVSMPMRLGLFLGLLDGEGIHLNSDYQFGLGPLKA